MAFRLPSRKRRATKSERAKFEKQIAAIKRRDSFQEGDQIRVVKNEKTGRMRIIHSRKNRNFKRKRERPPSNRTV